MAVSENFLKYVQGQLSDFGPIQTKRMFGGVGLFKEGLMFGKIGNDILWFKVDEYNQHDYEQEGMTPFYSEKKGKGMPYWRVPVAVIEDKVLLSQWANNSYAAAVRAKN